MGGQQDQVFQAALSKVEPSDAYTGSMNSLSYESNASSLNKGLFPANIFYEGHD